MNLNIKEKTLNLC